MGEGGVRNWMQELDGEAVGREEAGRETVAAVWG